MESSKAETVARASESSRLPAHSLPPGGRYLITGGGTGGHVYPAIAIADELRKLDPKGKFLYVGVKGRSEESIVPRRGYPLKFVHAEGWPGGKRIFALARFSLELALGLMKSIYLLLTFRPGLIIGSGGYVSAPIMMAALLLRRIGVFNGRTFIHEQNTFPGKLNRLVGSMVDKVGVSFVETLKYFPKTGIFVGYPVRRELGEAEREEARAALGIPAGKKVIFAFGGSQGARTINRALVEALPQLKKRTDLFIIHGTGTYKSAGYNAFADTESRLRAADLGDDPEFYLHRDYFHNIEQVYAVSDLVVCRGGAGTLTEIAARAIPCLIIPKANLPGDHQVKNARALAHAGAGRVIYERVELTEGGIEERVSGDSLARALVDLIDSEEELETMRRSARAYYHPGALDRIGNVLATLLDPKRPVGPTQEPLPLVREGPDFESLGPIALIRYLERREKRGDGQLSKSDQEYLEYRTDDYLASPMWQVRNRGVKLVGLLGYHDRLHHLLFMLKERKPVALPLRLMGGDFEQVGFIRRNIFVALRRLEVSDQGVWDAIQLGLEDNYFEARSEAAATAAHFAGRLGNAHPQITAQLRRRLGDSSFEVVSAAARALGKLSTDSAIIEDFRPFLFEKSWKVRQAVVEALVELHRREVLHAAQIRPYLESILITSNGFQPHFPLKNELLKLGQAMNQSPPLPDRPTPVPEDDA